MTTAEMEADLIATELAATKEAEELAALEAKNATPEEPPKAEPDKQEPPKVDPPAPQVDASAEVATLKAEKAEMEARMNELTKRIRDEDGRNGGKLAQLQDQLSKLSDQLRQVMDENRELRKKPEVPAAPAEPDALEAEYPDVAKGVDKRTRPAMDAATRAEQLAKENQAELARLRQAQIDRDYASFLSNVQTAVPDVMVLNSDQAFNAWLDGTDLGSVMSRRENLADAEKKMKAKTVIEIFQKWKNEQTNSTTPVVPDGKKPSKEAQVEVPKSSASSSQSPAKKTGLAQAQKRLKEVEHKVFVLGTGTKEERDEYNKLLDAIESGEIT